MKVRKNNRTTWLIAAIIAVFTTACFEYQESIKVDEDGAVTIKMLSTINEQVLPFIRNRPEFQFYAATAIGEEKLREYLPPSVEIISTNSVTERGWVHSDLQLKFSHIADVSSVMRSMSEDAKLSYYQDEDGSIVYERLIFQPKLPSDMPPKVAQSFAQKQWKDASMRFELETPLTVLETNGLQVSENKIVWQTNFAQVRELGLRLFARFAEPPLRLGWPAFVGSIITILLIGLSSGRRYNS